MKETVIRYLIVAALGAFLFSMASCTTGKNIYGNDNRNIQSWDRCAAYQ